MLLLLLSFASLNLLAFVEIQLLYQFSLAFSLTTNRSFDLSSDERACGFSSSSYLALDKPMSLTVFDLPEPVLAYCSLCALEPLFSYGLTPVSPASYPTAI